MNHNLELTGADLIFRSYNFGELMGGLKKSELTDKQKVTLEEYLSRVKISEKQAEERDRLIAIRDSQPELSDGGKTLVLNYFKEMVRGTSRAFVKTDVLDKGKECENMAIARICKVNGFPPVINGNKLGLVLKDEYGEGHPDAVINSMRIGFDAKCSFSDDSFPLFKSDLKDNNYIWQAKRYGMMSGFDKWLVCYSLENTPMPIVEREARKLWREGQNEGSPTDDFIDSVRQMHNFDHLPDWARVKTYEVITTQKDKDDVKLFVGLGRKYFDKLMTDYRNFKRN